VADLDAFSGAEYRRSLNGSAAEAFSKNLVQEVEMSQILPISGSRFQE
jgi:hypothetical protein